MRSTKSFDLAARLQSSTERCLSVQSSVESWRNSNCTAGNNEEEDNDDVTLPPMSATAGRRAPSPQYTRDPLMTSLHKTTTHNKSWTTNTKTAKYKNKKARNFPNSFSLNQGHSSGSSPLLRPAPPRLVPARPAPPTRLAPPPRLAPLKYSQYNKHGNNAMRPATESSDETQMIQCEGRLPVLLAPWCKRQYPVQPPTPVPPLIRPIMRNYPVRTFPGLLIQTDSEKLRTGGAHADYRKPSTLLIPIRRTQPTLSFMHR